MDRRPLASPTRRKGLPLIMKKWRALISSNSFSFFSLYFRDDSNLKLSLAFQKAILPSFEPDIKVFLSDENTSHVMRAWWNFILATSVLKTKSQAFITPSSAVEITFKESYSGKNTKFVITPLCPRKLWVWKPFLTSNTLMLLSAVPAARNLLLGSNASSSTI